MALFSSQVLASTPFLLFHLLVLLGLGQAGLVPSNQHVLNSGQESTKSHTSKQLEKVRHELYKAEIIPTVLNDFTPTFLLQATWRNDNKGKKKKAQASLGNTLKPKYLQDAPFISLHDPSAEDAESSSFPAISKISASTSSKSCSSADSINDRKSGKAVNTKEPGQTYVIALTDPDAPSRDDPKWSEFCHWIAISPGWKEDSDSDRNPIPGTSTQTRLEDGEINGDVNCHGLQHRGLGMGREVGTMLELDKLEEIVGYKPPSPPPKTGKHRYVLAVFVPANGTTERIWPSKPGDRKHWGYDDTDSSSSSSDDSDTDTEDQKGAARATDTTPGVRDWARENGLLVVGANFIYAENEKQ